MSWNLKDRKRTKRSLHCKRRLPNCMLWLITTNNTGDVIRSESSACPRKAPVVPMTRSYGFVTWGWSWTPLWPSPKDCNSLWATSDPQWDLCISPRWQTQGATWWWGIRPTPTPTPTACKVCRPPYQEPRHGSQKETAEAAPQRQRRRRRWHTSSSSGRHW